MVAVDANGQVVKERMIALESDKDMVAQVSYKFIQTLLEDEDDYKKYLKEDNTPGEKSFFNL